MLVNCIENKTGPTFFVFVDVTHGIEFRHVLKEKKKMSEERRNRMNDVKNLNVFENIMLYEQGKPIYHKLVLIKSEIECRCNRSNIFIIDTHGRSMPKTV